MKVPAARIVIPDQDQDWILSEMRQALDSGQLTLGRAGVQFEEEFAKRHNSAHAIAVNSGTAALEIALRAVGVAGADVIVPTNTFFATAAAVVHAGGVPRLADVGHHSFALTPETIEAAATPKTAGVIVVHIAGIITPDMVGIKSMCASRGWFLVEDAAHAHGSSLGGRPAGTFGDAGSFSFYPTKVITAGEGGMITTESDEIRKEALIYRDQGKEGFTTNFHVRMGYNWRMSELHALVGLSQLRRLDEFIATRQRVAALYDQALEEMDGIQRVSIPPECSSNYYKYLALLDEDIDRAQLKALLRSELDVSLSGEVYDTPLHRQPVFQEYSQGQFPVAEDLCARHVCLSISSDFNEKEAEYVLSSLATAIPKVRGTR